MDANKAQKLRDIGYEIRRACGTCEHARIDSHDDFGTCQLNEYEHLKHTGAKRKLSVLRYGVCSQYSQADWVEVTIHAFKEFMR